MKAAAFRCKAGDAPPLTHLNDSDYLAGKGVFDISSDNINALAIWSCRFWATYVVLCVHPSFVRLAPC